MRRAGQSTPPRFVHESFCHRRQWVYRLKCRQTIARRRPRRALPRARNVQTDRIDGLNWERFVGDVRSAESMAAGIEGCDAVIHLASPSSWNDIDSPHMADIVEGGTRHVLDAALAAGKPRVVYCSSAIAINGTTSPIVQDETATFSLNDPKMVYAMSKHKAELICDEYVEKHDLDIVTVNPAEVYGPNDTGNVTCGTLIDFAKSWPVLVSKGGTAVTHVDDVANGIVRALEKGKTGERYVLGGDNLTIEELARLTLDVLGKKAPVITMPTGALKALTAAAVAVRAPLPYNPLVIPYATLYWLFDNTKAKHELGVDFRPARETLASTLAWLKEEKLI
ncbi:MAG: NAD-dependent epimerase/dehydratase family protein [bacterium]